jgi:hypothetical protein
MSATVAKLFWRWSHEILCGMWGLRKDFNGKLTLDSQALKTSGGLAVAVPLPQISPTPWELP